MADRLQVGIVGCGEATQARCTCRRSTASSPLHAFGLLRHQPRGDARRRRPRGMRAVADPFGLIAGADVDVVLVPRPRPTTPTW